MARCGLLLVPRQQTQPNGPKRLRLLVALSREQDAEVFGLGEIVPYGLEGSREQALEPHRVRIDGSTQVGRASFLLLCCAGFLAS